MTGGIRIKIRGEDSEVKDNVGGKESGMGGEWV